MSQEKHRRRQSFNLPPAHHAWVSTCILLILAPSLPFCIRGRISPREIPTARFASVTPLKIDKNDRSCGGFPAAPIETMDGTCVGLVFQSDSSSFQPRAMTEIPGAPGKFLVTDFAGWSTTNGKIWLLDASMGAASVTLKPFLTGLSIVHQIVAGPGERIYFGEDGRISSFPVALALKGSPIERKDTQVVIADLPPMMRGTTKNSMHPIKHFVFDAQGNIFINIGAYTDHCNDFKGKLCEETDVEIGGGRSSKVKDHGGVIRRYAIQSSTNPPSWEKDYRIVAEGLRNSMGLLFTSKGDLIQVENGRDFNDSARPFEELNVISAKSISDQAPVGHYGWPYCYDHNQKSEEWENFSFSCEPGVGRYQAPYSLLPPHAAPLGILLYTADLMPALTSKLIVPLHGYRPAGHRLLALQMDRATGLPVQKNEGVYFMDDLSGARPQVQRSYPSNANISPAQEVISGWYDAPGVRGKGAPVAITQGSDGAIWIADDKNSAIFRLAAPNDNFVRLAPPQRPNFAKAYSELIMESPGWMTSYTELKNKLLKSSQCEGCHDDYQNPGDDGTDGLAELRYITSFGNWVVAKDPQKSVLFQKLSPPLASAMPPKDKPFANLQEAEQALAIVESFVNGMPALDSIFLVQEGAGAPVIGLVRGEPGNKDCGTLPPGYATAVENLSTPTLRGAKVRQIRVGPSSKVIDRSLCAREDTFFVAADALKAFVGP